MDRKKPIILDHAILKQKDKIPLKQVYGHTFKVFAKLYDKQRGVTGKKKSCNSLFFGDMFKSLMSGKSSYVTYLNDALVGKKKSQAKVPDYVRCIIKEMPSPTLPYYNEVVGSRLANLLGVDTVYNIAHQIDPDSEYAPDDYDYLISVDYLPDGYTDFDMGNIGVNFDVDDSLEDIMINLDRALRRMNKTGRIVADIDKVEEFSESFVKQYLFRNLICEDFDFCSRNVSFMTNKKGDFRMCPCFDMELFFQGKKSTDYYREVAERDLSYLQRTMPDVLEDFLSRCNNILQSGEIDRVMNSSIKAQDRSQFSKLIVKSNISKLVSIHQKLKESPEMLNQ